MARVMAVCLDVMDRPWCWGAADCCTAACDVFLRLHGVDPMHPLRGRYNTRVGALRAISRRGGWEVMVRDLTAQAGLIPSDGKPGDLGLIQVGDIMAMGICVEGGVWAGKSQSGLATVPECVRSWQCPQL